MDLQKMLDDIIAALGLPAGSEPKAVMDKVKKLTDFLDGMGQAAAPAATPGAEPDGDEVMAMAKDGMACTRDLSKLLKCDAKSEAVLAAVAKLQTVTTPKDDNEKIIELTRKLETMERGAACEKFIASNSKRIPPAQVEVYTEFYMENPERTVRLVAQLPELDLTKPIKHDDKADSDVLALTADEKEQCKQMGVTEEDFLIGKKVTIERNKQMKGDK